MAATQLLHPDHQLGHVAARDRTVALLPAFAQLFAQHPDDQPVLQRGSTVACMGDARYSLALALVAGPSQHGAWIGIAGMPLLGLRAAAEVGVALDRVVAVPTVVRIDGLHTDNTHSAARWAEVLAAMIDGFDVVVLGPHIHGVSGAVARRLQAKAKSRGVVTVVVTGSDAALGSDNAGLQNGGHWWESFDATLSGVSTWIGLGHGHGVARARHVHARLNGRRIHHERRSALWLPDREGVTRVDHSDTDSATHRPFVPITTARDQRDIDHPGAVA